MNPSYTECCAVLHWLKHIHKPRLTCQLALRIDYSKTDLLPSPWCITFPGQNQPREGETVSGTLRTLPPVLRGLSQRVVSQPLADHFLACTAFPSALLPRLSPCVESGPGGLDPIDWEGLSDVPPPPGLSLLGFIATAKTTERQEALAC